MFAHIWVLLRNYVYSAATDLIKLCFQCGHGPNQTNNPKLGEQQLIARNHVKSFIMELKFNRVRRNKRRFVFNLLLINIAMEWSKGTISFFVFVRVFNKIYTKFSEGLSKFA